MDNGVLENVRGFMTRTGMVESGDKILLAFSGGADSVAMTHILMRLSADMGFTVCAAHLNHCLRGAESDYDESFVRSFCESRGIPLTVEKADIAQLAKARRQGTEECARAVRYDFLFRAAAQAGANRIATAHTLSDNAETVLFNLTRGCGMNGLCGIPKKRGKLIRPVLCLSRADTEAYNKDEGLPFVTDSTNDDTAYTRNYIRKEIIPRLCEINPAFLSAVQRLTESAESDCEYIVREAEKFIAAARIRSGEYDLSVMRQAARPVLVKALSAIFRDFTGERLQYMHVTELCGFVLSEGNGRLQLPFGAFAVKYANTLSFTDSAKRIIPVRFFIEATGDDLLPDGRRVLITEHNASDGLTSGRYDGLIDAEKINGRISMRLRSPLDRLRLPKRPEKPLKKLFCEMKIPQVERDRAIVLCDSDGVLWVEGVGTAERATVDGYTKRIMKITTEEQEKWKM